MSQAGYVAVSALLTAVFRLEHLRSFTAAKITFLSHFLPSSTFLAYKPFEFFEEVLGRYGVSLFDFPALDELRYRAGTGDGGNAAHGFELYIRYFPVLHQYGEVVGYAVFLKFRCSSAVRVSYLAAVSGL